MKTYVFFISLLFLLFSCDPPRDQYTQGLMKIPFYLNNTADSISLGDSLCFTMETPDTTSINGAVTNVRFENNDGITIDLQADKMDTTFGWETRAFTPDCDFYANPGTLTNRSSLHLQKNAAGKMEAKLYLIPRKKGVYFLTNPQYGYFVINNESIKGRILITFNVPDKHHQLLVNTARPQNRVSFQSYINNLESMDQPVYGFAVK